MNETITISVITSCIWAVGMLVAGMYVRIKKIVDDNHNDTDKYINDIYNHIREKANITDKSIQEVCRMVDSRLDRLETKINNRIDSVLAAKKTETSVNNSVYDKDLKR
jgi:hypothetical protein